MTIDHALQAGQILSAFALLVLVILCIDVLRRDPPEVSYGGLTLGTSRLRWLWLSFLVGSTFLSATGDPEAVRESRFELPPSERPRSDQPRIGRTIDVPLPFYSFERSWATVDGTLVEDVVREGVIVPLEMLGAFLVYLILVVRWDPENRWALRILRGRRWSKKQRAKQRSR